MAETITLQDLAMMINIIDLVTKRGAFEGPELLVVGTLREKLGQFIKTAQEPTETQENNQVDL